MQLNAKPLCLGEKITQVVNKTDQNLQTKGNGLEVFCLEWSELV
jgi:hypothetical protein